MANNVVMQEKMDSLTAKNAQMKQIITANQAKNEKYHHVIDTTMSMTQATKEMKRDDTTLDTQKWLAFTASHENSLVTMQRRMEGCMGERTNTPPPAVIDTVSKGTNQKRQRGSLSDSPEGVKKTFKY